MSPNRTSTEHSDQESPVAMNMLEAAYTVGKLLTRLKFIGHQAAIRLRHDYTGWCRYSVTCD